MSQIYLLPTRECVNYKGKHPNRVRSVSYASHSGLHVTLNDGTRYWQFEPMAIPALKSDWTENRAVAVQMDDLRYRVLKEAAACARTFVRYDTRAQRDAVLKQARAMLLHMDAMVGA